MTKAKIQKVKDQLKKKWEAGEITASEYFDTLDLFDYDEDKALLEAASVLGSNAVYGKPKQEPQPAAAKMTQEEYEAAKKQKYQEYKAGNITNYAYIQWKKQNNPAVQPASGAVSAPAKKNAQTPVQKTTAQNAPKTAGMTQEEYNKAKSEMYQKYKNGEITNYAYIQWKKQNNPAVQQQAGQTPASPAGKAQTPVQDKTAAVGPKTAGNAVTVGSAEHLALGKELIKKIQNGEITHDEYSKTAKKINKLIKEGATFEEIKEKTNLQDAVIPQGWTAAEHNDIYDKLYEKKEKGVITDNELSALVNNLDQLEKTGTEPAYAEQIMMQAVQHIWQDGMTPDQAVGQAKLTPPGATKEKDSDEKYADLQDQVFSKEGILLNPAESDQLIEMLAYLQKTNTDPAQAEKQLQSAIGLIENNGFTVEEAMNVAAGYKPGMVNQIQGAQPAAQAGGPMTDEEYKELWWAINKKKKNGEITPDEELDLVNQLDLLQAQGTSKADAEDYLGIKGVSVNGDGKTIDELYEEMIDQAASAPDDHGFMDYTDANALIDMLEDMKSKGTSPEDAKQIMEAAIQDMEINGSGVNEAIEEAKKAVQTAANVSAGPDDPMTPAKYNEYIDMVVDLYKQGDCTEEQQNAMLDELQKLYEGQATEHQINSVLTAMAQGISAESAEQAEGVSIVKPMTSEEMFQVGDQLMEKYKSGKITWDEFQALNDVVISKMSQKASLEDVQQAVGLDPGTLATEKAVDDLSDELKDIYKQAAKELQIDLEAFEDEYSLKLNKKYEDLQNGKITQAEYDAWVNGQLMAAKTMRQKIEQLTGVTLEANKKAMAMINGEQLNVFADNASFQSFKIDKDANIDVMFSIYDEHTVEKLIKEKPELLPRKVVNGQKDQAWNQRIIANSITQGILQGESIPKLAKRIAADTASTNMKAMMRYARTAMTAAQNAGRMEMLHRAQGLGISVKKTWMATLDGRTRDSHAAMDGVTVGVDEKFPNGLMYPGDPNGPAGEVYNCRCTLVYKYEGMPFDPTLDQRRDQETGQMIATMSYGEWMAAKQGSLLNELNQAKTALAAAQKDVVKGKISETKKYSGIWKDDVTLADYPDKKDSIKAKRDYYTAEIDKYQQAKAEGKSWATDDKIDELEKKRKLLNEFELHGKVLQKRNDALQAVQGIYNKINFQKTATAPDYIEAKKKAAKKAAVSTQNPVDKSSPFTPDAYSKKRKDAALWTDNQRKVDSMMRARTGDVWRKATAAERDAIVEYTASYSKYNEPLRGIEYGTSAYKGVGKTNLDAGSKHNGKRLNALTDLLNKCSYDHDMWLQRGCWFGGMDKFLGISESTLKRGSEAELKKALLGKTITEYGFMSMGSAKGKGFDCDILFNIYAPAGTKMMYVEPFSHYGGGTTNWDGKSKQSSFGGEFETLLQQGTQFRITKVERSSRGFFIDIEVIAQDKQQRWTGKR